MLPDFISKDALLVVNAADKVRSLSVRDRRTVDGQLTLITENHAALLIAVNCNIFQRDLAGNVENAVGFVYHCRQ